CCFMSRWEAMEMTCGKCGSAYHEADTFCGTCGSPIGPNPIRAAGGNYPAQAERRRLTVMFCEIVGSTQLSGQLDPEELHDLIRPYQRVCADVIGRHAGHVAQFLGDGLLAYFGYPTAHEDDARRAVRAALEIVTALTQLAAQSAKSLHIRVAVHTGLVV